MADWAEQTGGCQVLNTTYETAIPCWNKLATTMLTTMQLSSGINSVLGPRLKNAYPITSTAEIMAQGGWEACLIPEDQPDVDFNKNVLSTFMAPFNLFCLTADDATTQVVNGKLWAMNAILADITNPSIRFAVKVSIYIDAIANDRKFRLSFEDEDAYDFSSTSDTKGIENAGKSELSIFGLQGAALFGTIAAAVVVFLAISIGIYYYCTRVTKFKTPAASVVASEVQLPEFTHAQF